MERFNRCSQAEKEALEIMFEYLGFNEVTTFEKYIDFMFLNAKENITFPHVFNHTLKHIVMSFWDAHPEYRNSYIKTFWIKPEDIKKYTDVGSKLEYDPKGMLRFYVKENFNCLYNTKK